MKWKFDILSNAIIDENDQWVADFSNEEEGKQIVKIHNIINMELEKLADNEYSKIYHRVGTSDGWYDGFIYAIKLLKNEQDNE